jgi:hypothetical protein
MVAVTEAGRVYRFGEDGAQEDVTGVPLSGGNRPIFTPTEEGDDTLWLSSSILAISCSIASKSIST